jgi:hypothetical protein
MPSYFRQVPDFEYISRDPNQRQISEYATVKNLFRRGKLRDDIFENLSFFTKYQIIGDERPDNVAYKVYNDETLDWVILLSNNIMNIQTEWPLPQSIFDKVMLEKYGSYEEFYSGIHHYETKEIRDSVGNLIFPEGTKIQNNWKSGYGFIGGFNRKGIISRIVYENNEVEFIINENIIDLKQDIKITISGATDSVVNGDFIIKSLSRIDTNGDGVENQVRFKVDLITDEQLSGNGVELNVNGNETLQFISTEQLTSANEYYYQYYDSGLGNNVLIPFASFASPITNYEYESKIEDDKRNIFILKPQYLNIVLNDMNEIMTYKKGSTQYVSRTLKRGDNIRLYD